MKDIVDGVAKVSTHGLPSTLTHDGEGYKLLIIGHPEAGASEKSMASPVSIFVHSSRSQPLKSGRSAEGSHRVTRFLQPRSAKR